MACYGDSFTFFFWRWYLEAGNDSETYEIVVEEMTNMFTSQKDEDLQTIVSSWNINHYYIQYQASNTNVNTILEAHNFVLGMRSLRRFHKVLH
jgi:hypothetical protein